MDGMQETLKAGGSPAGRPAMVIVGVGNGGCNAIQVIARQWPGGPRMIAVNTDKRSLDPLEGVERVRIGGDILRGLGAGGDARLARQAAAVEAEKIGAAFKDVEMVVFAVGLGGGTGSGVAPLLVSEAKKAGALTLCFAMLPFDFEGARRREQADRALQALCDLADGVVCLPCQRLTALVEDKANVQEAFRRAETMLALGIQELWRVLNRSSTIAFTFADLRAFLQDAGGNCTFCFAEGSGPGRVENAVEGIRSSALLSRCQALAEADAFAVCIIGGSDLSIAEIDSIVKGVEALGRKGAHVMTGVGCEPEWREKIHLTVLAAEKARADRAPARDPARRALEPVPTRPGETARPSRADASQPGLFDKVEQSRFKGVSPTIVDGSNLDIPTFIRRRIPIQKARMAGI